MAGLTTDMSLNVRLESLAIVQPGDTLIVAVDQTLTMENAQRYKEHLESRLPDVTVVVLNARQLAVYRRGFTSVRLPTD